jgi:hypothetical protein
MEMWRSKKVIIGAILAAVLLLGSLGGIVLAQENESDNGDSNHPRAEFLEMLAEKLGISVQELKDKIAEVREELPERDGEGWYGRRVPAGCFGNPWERLGVEIDEDAWKAAMAEARERIQAGEDRQEVMDDVLESFGIDIEKLKAACAEAWEARKEKLGERAESGLFGPGFGFRGFRGMPRMRNFGSPGPTG